MRLSDNPRAFDTHVITRPEILGFIETLSNLVILRLLRQCVLCVSLCVCSPGKLRRENCLLNDKLGWKIENAMKRLEKSFFREKVGQLNVCVFNDNRLSSKFCIENS